MKNAIPFILLLFLISCTNNSQTEENKSGSETTQETTETTNNKKFVWDFSQPKKYIYSFSQTSNSEHSTNKGAEADKVFVSGRGKLNIRVKEQNLADLSLTDMTMKMYDPFSKDTNTSSPPPMVIQDVNNKSIVDGDPQVALLLKVIIPLPLNDISKGEKSQIPMKYPFNVNGSRLFSQGFNTLEFIGYETYLGRKCAVLKGDIDVSDLDIPEELKGEYGSSITGTGTYYFDVKDHFYVGAEINMVTEVLMDSENDDDINGIYMKSKNTDTYSLSFEKTENIEFDTDDTAKE